MTASVVVDEGGDILSSDGFLSDDGVLFEGTLFWMGERKVKRTCFVICVQFLELSAERHLFAFSIVFGVDSELRTKRTKGT